MIYSKAPITVEQQIAKLKQLGLIIKGMGFPANWQSFEVWK